MNPSAGQANVCPCACRAKEAEDSGQARAEPVQLAAPLADDADAPDRHVHGRVVVDDLESMPAVRVELEAAL